MPLLLALPLLLVFVSTAAAIDEVTVSSKAELLQAASQAKPGTVITISAKSLPGGIYIENLQGSPDLPIVIRSLKPTNRCIIEGGIFGMQIAGPAHIVLENLEIRGATQNGLNIDDAGRSDSPAQHVLLRNLYIHDIGPNGNCDGIKLSGVDHLTIENCRLERWGKGGSAIDMVGCHKGIVRNCTMKSDPMHADNGLQLKGGTSEIVVSRCLFAECGQRGVNIGGSTGLPYFRPQGATYEARNITVEDCTFLSGIAAIAFVGVDGAIVQHNTIVAPGKWVIRILQETTEPGFVPCRKGIFRNNVVQIKKEQASQIVNVGPNTSPDTFQLEGNAWFATNGQISQRELRLPVEEKAGIYNIDPQLEGTKGGMKVATSGQLSGRVGVREQK
ncbi:right-handed parallel beta-helix repeat-containing protein [Bremerella sp.]|uniref:right-handed parallel beta-helix repeat-containing protein n=1 Tax=Bremerella sp. TaxID=2795602 RepID=UPI00391C8B89